MGKISYKRLKGGKNLRQRLLLSTLSAKPVLIERIRADDTLPGLRRHELSFLRLLEKICDGCCVEINETGTKLKYKPGIVMGGGNLEHDCGVSRSIGYFLEPLIVLGLFAKKPIRITLTGITNDHKDPSVDTFQSTTLPLLRRFGVPSEGLELKIESRGVPPKGGGKVTLSIPVIQSLTAVNWIDEGLVKRIRGNTFSTRVSSQSETSMIKTASGIFKRLLPDVFIDKDHKTGEQAGNSPGFGISLHAKTTSGCLISVDTAIAYERDDDLEEMGDVEKKELMRAETVGEGIAFALLQEIEQGGVVDSTHQGLLFLLCALGPPDISKICVGKLSPYGMETLKHIKEFLDVMFIELEPSTGTVILSCMGCGMKNLSRKSW